MSKKEDNDKAKMSQCERKSMVIQGIKDRSKIRCREVTEKQGCGDEGETRESREGKQGKIQRRVSVGRRGDPGEIQGRSIDLGGSVFRSVGGSIGKGTRREGAGTESKNTRTRARRGLGGEGEDESRMVECGGVLGSLVRSDEGRSEEQGEKKT